MHCVCIWMLTGRWFFLLQVSDWWHHVLLWLWTDAKTSAHQVFSQSGAVSIMETSQGCRQAFCGVWHPCWPLCFVEVTVQQKCILLGGNVYFHKIIQCSVIAILIKHLFSGTWATCTPWMPSTHQTQLTKIFSHTTRCNRWWRQNKPDLWSSTKRQLWPKDHVQPIFFERIWLSGDKDVEERGTGDSNLHKLCPWVKLVPWHDWNWPHMTVVFWS